MDAKAHTTRLMTALCGGDRSAADELTGLLYGELRQIAQAQMRRERGDHTLQATAVVHEAYLRLVDQRCLGELGRLEFLALASRTIRRVLVDHAKAAGRIKRGQGRRVTLYESSEFVEGPEIEVLDLEDALEELALLDPRQANMVELRLYGGLSDQEMADVLHVSKSTIEKDWRHARAWLRVRLEGDELAD